MNEAEFDVLVVGAGLAGSALCCALRGSGLRIALVEAEPLPGPAAATTGTAAGGEVEGVAGFDARVSAITPASKTFLQKLGVWNAELQGRACAYDRMRVWDGEGSGAIEFRASELAAASLGAIVENRLLNGALLAALLAAPDVVMYRPARLESLHSDPGGTLRLGLDDGREPGAALVVAADGARSRLRQLAEMPTREWDYHQHALVCTVETELPHRHTAYQIFRSSGPLALLPLPDIGPRHFCSLVWSVDSELAPGLGEMGDTEFLRELQRAFESRLGRMLTCSPRLMFPLRQRHALDYVRPGLALLGDAAHTIHPLAGQGVNLGLADARVLSTTILRAVERGQNPGELAVLKRYQRQRKGDNLLMMAAMEGFKHLFAQRAPSLRVLRGTGMRLVGRSGPLKRRLMRHAMGLS